MSTSMSSFSVDILRLAAEDAPPLAAGETDFWLAGEGVLLPPDKILSFISLFGECDVKDRSACSVSLLSTGHPTEEDVSLTKLTLKDEHDVDERWGVISSSTRARFGGLSSVSSSLFEGAPMCLSRNVLAAAGTGTEASAASLRVLLEDAEDLRTIPMFSQLIGSDSMGVVNG